VIACGAGFPAGIKPDDSLAFEYYSLVGIYDFNFSEIAVLRDAYSEIRRPHQFVVFDGTHDWPPKEQITDAIAWLDLRAMANQSRSRDDAAINAAWQRGFLGARELEQSGKRYEAYLGYRNLLSTFAGLRDTTGVSAKVEELKDSREIREGRKREQKMDAETERLEAPVRNAMAGLQQPTPDFTLFSAARDQVKNLRKRRESEHDPERLIPIRRALGGIMIGSFEAAQSATREKQYSRAGWLLEIASDAAKNPADVLVEAAANFALAKDRKHALSLLREARKLGFADWDALSSDERFKEIVGSDEFRTLQQS
jgi:hypothetical protein